uniref:Uncharacterized protein n=1 Tax=Mesocestoides corti TaxID=53468 RepID=A0A5K3FRT8_MESCO
MIPQRSSPCSRASTNHRHQRWSNSPMRRAAAAVNVLRDTGVTETNVSTLHGQPQCLLFCRQWTLYIWSTTYAFNLKAHISCILQTFNFIYYNRYSIVVCLAKKFINNAFV